MQQMFDEETLAMLVHCPIKRRPWEMNKFLTQDLLLDDEEWKKLIESKEYKEEVERVNAVNRVNTIWYEEQVVEWIKKGKPAIEEEVDTDWEGWTE